MKTLLVVLWMFHPAPWSLGPIPLTAGWFSTKHVYSSVAECKMYAPNFLPPHRIGFKWACIPAGEKPKGTMGRLDRDRSGIGRI